MLQDKVGSHCEFVVNVNEDRSVSLQSVKLVDQSVTILQNGQTGRSVSLQSVKLVDESVTILQNGQAGRCERQLGNVTRQFHIHCKV